MRMIELWDDGKVQILGQEGELSEGFCLLGRGR